MGEIIDFVKAKLLRKQQAEQAAEADWIAKTQQIQDVLNRFADELRQEMNDESE